LEAEDLAAALHREVAEEKKGVAYAPVADPAMHPLEKGNAREALQCEEAVIDQPRVLNRTADRVERPLEKEGFRETLRYRGAEKDQA